MTPETFNLASIFIYTFSAIIALGMFGVAIYQLIKLRSQVEEAIKANKINGLQTFLEIEKQISDSRRELAKTSLEIKSLEANNQDITPLSLYFSECLENHLNSLDRLCFCILKEYFDNEEMKIEYRHIINDAVTNNKGSFELSTKHRNIKKIYDKWADS